MSTLPLNVNQKRVVFGAVAVLILMFLCPPWHEQSQSQMYHEDTSFGLRGSSDRTHGMGLPLFHESFSGYHWLLNAPSGRFDYDQDSGGIRTYKGTSYGYHIAWGILFMQWLLVSLVSLALVHRYRDKPQVFGEPKTSVAADKPTEAKNIWPDESPEIIASKPDPKTLVEKDIIPAKPTIKTAMLIVFGVGACLIILIGIVIALASPKSATAPQTPAPPANLTQKFEGILKEYEASKPAAAPLGTKPGVASMENGNYEHAIIEFNKSIDLEPLNHKAYNNRGEAHLKLGNYQRARQDFSRAIISCQKSKDSKTSDSLHDLNVHLDASMPNSDGSPPEAKYYRNRGLAYEKLGNKKQAIVDMKTAAKSGDKEAQKYLLSKEMTW